MLRLRDAMREDKARRVDAERLCAALEVRDCILWELLQWKPDRSLEQEGRKEDGDGGGRGEGAAGMGAGGAEQSGSGRWGTRARECA